MTTRRKVKAKPVESGSRHLDPRRTFRCSKEEFAEQDRAAKALGKSWTDWMRDAAHTKLWQAEQRGKR